MADPGKAASPALAKTGWIAPLALVLAFVGPILALVGLLAMKFGWLSYATSTFLVHRAPTSFALSAIAFGVVAFALSIFGRARRALIVSLLAGVIGTATYALIATQGAQAARFPPVHDVATNWRDPLLFTPKLMAERGADANPVVLAPTIAMGAEGGLFAGKTVADVNAQTCPAATPVVLAEPVSKAYDDAKSAIARLGMTLVTDNPPAGMLEATASTFWGMKEDLAVRVWPEGAGARIDMRVVARHGRNDRGQACAWVTRLRAALASGG